MRTAKVAAKNGYRIELTPEPSGVLSYDAKMNGVPTEFKSLKNHNNIYKEGKDTIRKGAKTILYEVPQITPKVNTELNRVKSKGISVYYYGRERKIHEV